jgi:uncharacterized protein GlcG (DUF336 family)
MKLQILVIILSSCLYYGQNKNEETKPLLKIEEYVKTTKTLTLDAALEMSERVFSMASKMDKKVSLAILDASGTTVLLLKDDMVGPHNTDAARKKAFTALSTKTPTLLLLRNADKTTETRNLNTVSDLLLLSGGIPIYFKGEIIGSIGVAGGGSPENDDLIARAAAIPEYGITTKIN